MLKKYLIPNNNVNANDKQNRYLIMHNQSGKMAIINKSIISNND